MNKKLRYSVIFICVFILAAVVTGIAANPTPKVIFNVMSLQSNNGTTQGFVDIDLEGINATSVSFCLQYDKNYIEISKASDNSVMSVSGSSDYDTSGAFFAQNKTNFPGDCFYNMKAVVGQIGVGAPIIGILKPTSGDNGYIMMNFKPILNSASANIGTVTGVREDLPAIMSEGKTDSINIGKISFKVKDPAEFSKLSESQLRNVLKVVPFSKTMDTFSPALVGHDTGLEMSFINSFKREQWYSNTNTNVLFKYNIEAEIQDVKPQTPKVQTNAFELFKNNSKSDLIDLLNEKSALVTLSYTDGSEVPDTFKWDAANAKVYDLNNNSAEVTTSWEPKGGKYKVSQKYNDKFTVEVEVEVAAVTLTDYRIENEEETYLYTDGNPPFPQKLADLNLPGYAQAVLTPYIPNCGIDKVPIEQYTRENGLGLVDDLHTSLSEFYQGSDVSVTLVGTPPASLQLPKKYPWLTIDSNAKIKAKRNVITNASDMPLEITASGSTDSNGILTILVEYADGTTQMTGGESYKIKLPNGELLDTAAVTTVPSLDNGKLKIVVTPNIASDEYNERIAQVINLGSRAGNFEVAVASSAGKPMTQYADCTPDPRHNYYLQDTYTFDYTGETASSVSAEMFPVKPGTQLPTTITLSHPDHNIDTTYDGYDGSESGYLKTFTVDSWTIVGDINTPGATITAEGTLSDTEYTNYGYVSKPAGLQGKVTLKYVVSDDKEEDKISDIGNFTFDSKQVGYDYGELQTKNFTISNVGAADIYGATVDIEISDATLITPVPSSSPEPTATPQVETTTKEAFLLTKKPLPIVKKGGSTDFEITPKHGLPIGTYVSTVTITSNNKTLDTFTITFTVTEAPTYNIELSSNDEALGKAETKSGTNTACEGETVELIAKPETDCVLKEWQVVSGGVTITTGAQPNTASFIMPKGDVKIKAIFEETLGAKLRATDLMVLDKDEAQQQLYTKDKNGVWVTATFAPATREYYVAVDNEVDKAKLRFKLREEAKDATVTISNTYEPPTPTASPAPCDTITPIPPATDGGYYNTDLFDLYELDDINTVKITITPDTSGGQTADPKEYAIHIYRKLTDAERADFNYGNSPYGLIMNDSELSDSQRQQLKTKFDQKRMFKQETTGVKEVPDGAPEGIEYTVKAWENTGVDYDRDDYALFVRNSSAFSDPGYKEIRNSIGEKVADSNISLSVSVKTLAQTDNNKYGLIADDFLNTETTNISIASAANITELSNYRIRPDAYQLTYSYKDFNGVSTSVTKPLIVLADIGDVNLHEGADNIDTTKLLKRYGALLPSHTSVVDYALGGRLYKYRICDVNADGNVNAIDANNIRAGNTTDAYNFYKNTSTTPQGGGGS